ncbi:plasminogen-like [Convolutriloba macropyga]|uniref:plasminogen-like n=1 Tax=Convolutriloba macropyga TaxID=536237 RepID=UPI003F51B8B6
MTVKNEMMSKIVIWFIFITSFVIFLNLQTLEAINFPEKEVKTWNANKFQSSINSFIVNGLVSQPTLFYAKIRFGRGSTEFCGATIVDEIFVMTSAFCVYSYHPSQLTLEVGDFSEFRWWNRKTRLYNIKAIYIAPGFIPSLRSVNDLAILKLSRQIKHTNRTNIFIPICQRPLTELEMHQVLLGTCGMGSNTGMIHSISSAHVLHETVFTMSLFDNEEGNFFTPCRSDNICTDPVFHGSNICNMDFGGPLYRMKCGSMQPECLLGIASYAGNRSTTPLEICNSGSYFVKISQFYPWIIRVFMNGY